MVVSENLTSTQVVNCTIGTLRVNIYVDSRNESVLMPSVVSSTAATSSTIVSNAQTDNYTCILLGCSKS